MATKSIIKNIEISDPAEAEKLVKALEEAAEKVIPTCNVTKLPCAGCNPCCEHKVGEFFK